MTETEYITANADIRERMRVAKRMHYTLMEIESAKHRENMQNEDDRHRVEVRKLKAEYMQRNADLEAVLTQARIARAKSREEEMGGVKEE